MMIIVFYRTKLYLLVFSLLVHSFYIWALNVCNENTVII